jgi:excisionase family DNA binding protein
MAIIIDDKPYELISKVAQQLGVTRVTLYRASKLGLIPFVRVGRNRLIDLEAAQRFVREIYRRDLAEAMKRTWRKRKQKSKVKEKWSGYWQFCLAGFLVTRCCDLENPNEPSFGRLITPLERWPRSESLQGLITGFGCLIDGWVCSKMVL